MVDGPSQILDDETETQPLLGLDSRKLENHLPNPLPKQQLALVLLLQVCESITSYSIHPYINQVHLVRRSREVSIYHFQQLIIELGITGGDDRKVGYYAGLIVAWKLFLAHFVDH